MSGIAAYPYAQGALLERPHSYFYSAYGGAAFVQAWRADRAACHLELARTAQQTESACKGPTADCLRRWAEQLSTSGLSSAERQRIDALLRNFEAKKRLFEDYYPGFNSRDRTDFQTICLYVRFAEVLVLAYQRWHALPYLNALLKCLDILCAERGRLAVSDRARVAAMIAAEATFVAALADKLGVTA